MSRCWFAGPVPCAMLRVMRLNPEAWGSWLALTADDAHKLMMLVEVEALRLGMEVQLYCTPLYIEGPGMATPAWSIAARVVSGEWQDVEEHSDEQ